jgi:hypothetical protein
MGIALRNGRIIAQSEVPSLMGIVCSLFDLPQGSGDGYSFVALLFVPHPRRVLGMGLP